MNQQASDSLALWNELVRAYQAYAVACYNFGTQCKDRAGALKVALRSAGMERHAALHLAGTLKPEERMALFPEWVYLASWAHGALRIPQEMIYSLPREWVLERIEQEAEPYLESGTYDEFRRFLELYEGLDTALMLKLAHRAASHADPDIREAGEDFLHKHQATSAA